MQLAVPHNPFMQTRAPSRWWLRAVTLCLAGLATASASYWALKWSSSTPSPAGTVAAVPRVPNANSQSISRLMGASPTAPTAATTPVADANGGRLKLIGVVAGRAERGYALISVDGKPARPIGVGGQVTEQLVLKSVAARSAALAPDRSGPATLTLELPKPPTP